jgi:hypothetical protein
MREGELFMVSLQLYDQEVYRSDFVNFTYMIDCIDPHALLCAGREVQRDPLQSSQGWQDFTAGWLVHISRQLQQCHFAIATNSRSL